jgi:hypothetical protein
VPEDGGTVSGDRLAELDAIAHRLGLALKTVIVRKAAAPYSLGSSSTITTRRHSRSSAKSAPKELDRHWV